MNALCRPSGEKMVLPIKISWSITSDKSAKIPDARHYCYPSDYDGLIEHHSFCVITCKVVTLYR